MKIQNFTNHIQLKQDNGNIYLSVDDVELFDFIEDYLIENINIEYDHLNSVNGNTVIVFKNTNSFDLISNALSKLDQNEIIKIREINFKH